MADAVSERLRNRTPPASSRTVVVFEGIGIALVTTYFLLPGGAARAAIVGAVTAAAPIAAAFAAVRCSGLARLAWCALATGMVLGTAPTVGAALSGRAPSFPGPLGSLSLLAYPAFVIGLTATLGTAPRSRPRDEQRGDLFDWLIIVAGGATALGAYVATPILRQDGWSPISRGVALLHPVLDLLLFALLTRLLVGSRPDAADLAIGAGLFGVVVADAIWIGQAAEGGRAAPPAQAALMAAALAFAAAASTAAGPHVSAPDARPARRIALGGRWPFLAAALLVAPLLLVAPGELRSTAARVAAISATVVTVLVAVRLSDFHGRLARLRADIAVTNAELRRRSRHDDLTGLPNRALVVERLEWLLARTRRSERYCALLLIDIDGFGQINDTRGHDIGDQLLRAVAGRLTGALREVDTIGRIAADEFAVLLDDVVPDSVAEVVAQRVIDAVRLPFDLVGAPPTTITTSVGGVVGARDTAGKLLRAADLALVQAKASGKNRYEFFRPEMESVVQRRYEIELDLRTALVDDQFELMFQPIYDLDDVGLVGFEALLRWNHPDRGQVQPDDFVPVLEESGDIVEVGSWVLAESCRHMARWRALGHDLMVSVNVSACQLDHDAIVEDVRKALRRTDMDASALTIEVTETALMHNVEATARRLHALKALGVQVAIDDFGTGYSSLAYLQQFPVDCLKIDRTFTDAITRSPESEALIHTLVQLGKDLGLRTLAEGVETSAQMARLRQEDVNAVQGFLFARPMTVEAIEEELAQLRAQRVAIPAVER